MRRSKVPTHRTGRPYLRSRLLDALCRRLSLPTQEKAPTGLSLRASLHTPLSLLFPLSAMTGGGGGDWGGRTLTWALVPGPHSWAFDIGGAFQPFSRAHLNGFADLQGSYQEKITLKSQM